MDLQLLRDRTAVDHDQTESAVPLMDPGLSRERYIDMLQRFHRVIGTWEDWLAAHAPADLRHVTASRSRCDLIQQDLRHFRAAPASALPDGHMLAQLDQLLAGGNQRAAILGAMYVVEGSRLGGQFIAKHLETTFGLEPGEGDSYFRGFGAETMPRWREFQQLLREVPEYDAEALISAARSMFAIFGEAMTAPPGVAAS